MNGNTYFLVVTDWFSKDVVFQPFRAAEHGTTNIFAKGCTRKGYHRQWETVCERL
jgi:hypothetical protein